MIRTCPGPVQHVWVSMYLIDDFNTQSHGKVVVVRQMVCGVTVLEGSGYETECVRGICVDFSPTYLYVCSRVVQVEIIKAAKSRVCGYKRAFLRLLTFCFFTHTHAMVVVMRQNVCDVPAWTCVRNVSMFETVGPK
jgi:hypothetical protein